MVSSVSSVCLNGHHTTTTKSKVARRCHKPPQLLQNKTTRTAQAGNRTDAVRVPASAKPHLVTVFTSVSSLCDVGRGPLLAQIPRDNSSAFGVVYPFQGGLFVLLGWVWRFVLLYSHMYNASKTKNPSKQICFEPTLSLSLSLSSFTHTHTQSGFARFSRCLFTLCRPTDNRSTLATCRPLTPDLHLLNTNHLT